MTAPSPGWYADQANPQLLRWWDGNGWTPHTQPNPQAAPPRPQAPPPPPPPPQQYQQQPVYQQPQQQGHPQQQGYPQQQQQYQQQAAGFAPQQQQMAPQAPGMAGGQVGGQAGGQVGGGPLYLAPELLIAQKAKVFGISSSAGAYQIMDATGAQVGTFKEPETLASKAMDKLNPLADFKAKDFELTDAQGTVVLKVENPQGFKAALKPKFHVSAPSGMPVGTIEQQKVFSGLGFVFTVNGQNFGHFEQTRGGGFSRRFICKDGHGNQIAEFVKRSVGKQSFKEVFTHDDSYVLLRPNPIPEPLGSLVLISACALDATFFEKD